MPVYEGKPLDTSEYANLPEETKKSIGMKILNIETRMDETMRKIKALEREARKQLQTTEKEFGLSAIKPSIETLKHKYKDYPEVVSYLDEVQRHPQKHKHIFT